MKFLRWILYGVVLLVVVVLTLDTFGGKLFDGPLGPIPGGAFSGPVSPETNPAWENLEDVIELEIRPEEPWSLSVWGVVVDGNLYIPSGSGANRRWTPLVLEDPRVRVRTNGRIYEQKIEKLDEGPERDAVVRALAEKYSLAPDPEASSTLWVFRVGPR